MKKIQNGNLSIGYYKKLKFVNCKERLDKLFDLLQVVYVRCVVVCVILLGVFLAGFAITGRDAYAGANYSNILSGYQIKSAHIIYYRINKTLYAYNTKTKRIKKLHKFKKHIGCLYKYKRKIYLQLEKGSNGFFNVSDIYSFDVATKKTRLVVKKSEFLGVISGSVYVTDRLKKDKPKDKVSIFRIAKNGTKEKVVAHLGESEWIGSDIVGNCFIWNNKLYFTQQNNGDKNAEKEKADDEKKDESGSLQADEEASDEQSGSSSAKSLKGSEEGEDSDELGNLYYCMNASGKVKKLSQKKYMRISNYRIRNMYYPEKNVTNMISSYTTVTYGKKKKSYWDDGDGKKKRCIYYGKSSNHKKKIFSIPMVDKKYWRSVYTGIALKNCVVVIESRLYKKKKGKYDGKYIYSLVSNKGKVIKKLGKMKFISTGSYHER